MYINKHQSSEMGWGRCWDLSHCVPSRAAGAITAITRVAEVVVMCGKFSVGRKALFSQRELHH